MKNQDLTQEQANAPLIHGERVTFTWYGEAAPLLVGDFTDWHDGKPVEMRQVASGEWQADLNFHPKAYIEYAFSLQNEHLTDPLNLRRVSNGMGKFNSYFYMPDAQQTTLTRPLRGQAAGKLTTHMVTNPWFLLKGSRRVHLYRPAAPGPYPLVVVWDGRDYLRNACLVHIVDNLIHQRRISPIALALVENAGAGRVVEYACAESSVAFLVQDVLPLAHSELDLLDLARHPGAFGIMGASMGGLMSLYTGLRLPHVFGHVLSQSGAFSLDDFDFYIFQLLQLLERQPLKIWMDVGQYEWLLGANRRMRDLLGSKEYDVTYQEYPAGHNYTAWREEVWQGIEHLFSTGHLSR